MGTDLYQIGNHKISFKNRRFKDLVIEIKTTLDNTVFPNAEFLKLFALKWHCDNPRKIREIKTKQDWTYLEESEYYNFEKDKEIELYGPFGLELSFYENRITFWNPPYRYWQWFEMKDNVFRDEWRKYMLHIVKLFGGNRVLYVADNGHHLDEFICYEGSFEEMEAKLLKKHGKPKTRFQEIASDIESSYLIDYFKNIDWSKSTPLKELLPEPDDTSSIEYDLKVYSCKENLKKLKFDDEILHHKLINDEIHFYHLARVKGLLCVHSGIVAKKENLVVNLDKYAPFTFDKIQEMNQKDGYGNQCDINLIIKLYGWKNIDSWRDAFAEFELEIKWQGLGQKAGGSYGGDEQEEWFYLVDEKRAIKLLLNIGKRHETTGKIEVYRHNRKDFWDEQNNKDRKLIFKQ